MGTPIKVAALAAAMTASGALVVNFLPGQTLSSSQLNQVQLGKADAQNGRLTAPQITGGTLSGTDVTNGNYVTAGAQLRSVAGRLNDAVYLSDYGAKCDGITDDTLAIQAWIAYAAGKSHVHMVAPAGVCRFTQPLSIQSGDNLYFGGVSQKATTFLYTGLATTSNILTFAGVSGANVNTNDWENWHVGHFRVLSDTKMTGGAAVVFNRLSEGIVTDIAASDMDLSPRNLYDGIWFDGVHVVMFDRYAITTQHDGLIVNGIDGHSNTNIWIGDGYSDYNGRYGLLIGGGVGGVFCDRSEYMGNNAANVAVTDEKNSLGNREIFFGPQVVSDGLQSGPAANASRYGIYVNAPASPAAIIVVDAYMTAATQDSLELVSCPNCTVTVGSPRITFNRGDGIRYSDASINLTVGAATRIDLNGGYAINATVATGNIASRAVAANNAAGDYSINANVGTWSAWAPTAAASTGTLGGYTVSSARYKKSGRTVTFSAEIVLTANGTGSGAVVVTLPYPAASGFAAGGRANAVSGKILQGLGVSGSNTLSVLNYDGTYPGADGEHLIVSGTYEASQ